MKKWQAIALVFSIIVTTVIIIFSLLVIIVMKDRGKEINEKKQIIMYETNEIFTRLYLLSENGEITDDIEKIELLMSELDEIEYEVDKATWCSTESVQFEMACSRYKSDLMYFIGKHRKNVELMSYLASNLGKNEKEEILRSLDEVNMTMESENIKNETIWFLNTNYH